ncbi:MAG: glycerate kinase [Lachnospiraceae bacterium]|nr:glycerate kinase [Lachnospiraceae bacterium]
MNEKLKNDASVIIKEAVQAVLPGQNVKKVLFETDLGSGDIYVVAVGKAAYTMAKAAEDVLRGRIKKGLVITKYGHMKSEIPGFDYIEAGHPNPDENSYRAAEAAIEMVKDLSEKDHVLFLLSGGASALFEKPVIAHENMEKINQSLLLSGANIFEINTVRKHLSFVKGGRFAALAAPAHVDTVVLSDVLSSDLSFVGSGPTYPDETTGEQAFSILEKYRIGISADTIEMLMTETPKTLNNVSFFRIGDVRMLTDAAKEAAEKLGYQTVLLTNSLDCEAREAGAFFASIARSYATSQSPIAFIAGGETVVHVKGNGKGGRNQEMALAASKGIAGLDHVAFFSIGSDGTDGPTDAAGGIVSGDTAESLEKNRISYDKVMEDNDAYHALEKIGSLIITGPTGTNVNDLSVLLIRP